MALLQCTIKSKALDMTTGVNVLLPQDVPAFAGAEPPKVLYLLHGLSDNCTNWLRFTSLERYARQYNLAVVLPEVNRSFYTDMDAGLHYFTYVSEELPALCGSMFRLSERPADTYVAGLSMGGYGALKLALRFPGRYAGCAAFSAVTDLRRRMELDTFPAREALAIFGPERELPADCDLFRLAEAAPQPFPARLFLTCGAQDFLYQDNVAFRDHLLGLGFRPEYREWPGCHEWGFWDKSIRLALDYFLG